MRPTCTCHDEPMYWNKDGRLPAGGRWYCAAKHRAHQRERYERMSGPKYSRRLLQIRRQKALMRRRKRHEARAA